MTDDELEAALDALAIDRDLLLAGTVGRPLAESLQRLSKIDPGIISSLCPECEEPQFLLTPGAGDKHHAVSSHAPTCPYRDTRQL